MNHSERIAYTARQHRHLTRHVVRDAVETYLQQLAVDIATGAWIEIPGIGKIQVVQEAGAGQLLTIQVAGQRKLYPVKRRLRTKLRLTEEMKTRCYQSNP